MPGVVEKAVEGRRSGMAGVFKPCGPEGVRTGIGTGIVGRIGLFIALFPFMVRLVYNVFAVSGRRG